jgi:hypothetical protein
VGAPAGDVHRDRRLRDHPLQVLARDPLGRLGRLGLLPCALGRRGQPLPLRFGALAVMDVDRGPEPADDLAGRRVPVRLGAHQEPAVVPGRRPDAVLDHERAAGATRLVERRERRGPVVRVHEAGGHVSRRGRLVVRSGVVGPLLVEELDAPVRVGDPDDLRHRVGHQPEPLLALAQGGPCRRCRIRRTGRIDVVRHGRPPTRVRHRASLPLSPDPRSPAPRNSPQCPPPAPFG